MTPQEIKTYLAVVAIQANYWQKFMNESFSGLTNFEMPYITYLDWVLLVLNGNYDQTTALTAIPLFDSCSSIFNQKTFCLENFVTKSIPDKYYNLSKYMKANVKLSNFTASFKEIFSTLWYAKLPCYDTVETRPCKSVNKGIKKKQILKS